jgi:hypothetical protein
MLYVLTICVSLLSGDCTPNYMAFDSPRSCEAARSALKGEFTWAKCTASDRRSALTHEPEPLDDDSPAAPDR